MGWTGSVFSDGALTRQPVVNPQKMLVTGHSLRVRRAAKR
jgi:hypothetical protein